MRRPCRTQDPQSERFRAKACPGPDPEWIPVRVTKTRQTQNALSRSSIRSSVVVAGANGADVVAVNIELANETAAAIAAIIRAIVRSDRAADDCGPNQACADAPAEAAASGLCLGGGGSEAAGEGKRGERESGNSGLDRHEKLHPVVGGRCGSHAQLDGACSIPVRFAVGEITS